MLKPAKKKITKKDLKEDKFVAFVLKLRTYAEENSRQLVTTTAVIVGIILIIVLYRNHQKNKTEQSLTLLGEAQVEMQNYNFSKAEQLLQHLVNDFSGSDAAAQGNFLLGNIYYQKEEYAKAKEYFKTFIDEYDGSPILLASGLAGYAACLEKEGAHEDAARFYLKAQKAAPGFYEAPNYLYLAGRNFLQAGNYEQARKVFSTIEEKYADSQRARDAKIELIMLSKKIG